MLPIKNVNLSHTKTKGYREIRAEFEISDSAMLEK